MGIFIQAAGATRRSGKLTVARQGLSRLTLCLAAAMLMFTLSSMDVRAQIVTEEGDQKGLTYEETSHYMRFSADDGPQTYEYKFKNETDKPVMIYFTRVSCHCMSAERPKKPIAPGDEGVIKVTYDNENNFKEGSGTAMVNHKVYVYDSTSEEPVVLKFSAGISYGKKE